MIEKIVMMDFRGHNRTLEFSPNINTLCGPNESGKSTVKEAIAFVFQGTDSAGTKSPDHLISKDKDAMEVMIVTEHAKISRRKRRGQTSVIKLERHGYPGIQLNQTEWQAQIKMGPEAFMSCWNAGYFMSLPQAQQLTVLGELAAVDRRALLQAMLPTGVTIPSKVKLVSPKVDADAMATERRQVQNVKASDEGALKQVKAQLETLNGGPDVDIESYAARLNEVNAQLEAHDFYKKALSKYQVDKLQWGTSINRKGGCEAGLMALNLHAEAEFTEIRRHLEKNRVKYNDIMVSINTLQKKTKPMPAAPKKPNLQTAGECDKCGQAIDATHVKKIMASYESELLAHNKEAREVQTHNDRIKLAIEKGHEAARDIDMESTQLTGTLSHGETANREMLKRKAELERELEIIAKLKEPSAPSKPDGDEAALRAEQLEINTALNVARMKESQLKQFQTQESQLVEAIQGKDKQIMALGAIEHSLKQLPQVETMKLLESLQVPGIEVTFNEGNLGIGADGIPYSSLSSGRKMKADLMFCVQLRRSPGAKAPLYWIFADNADLMDRWRDLLPEGIQIFAAKVDGNLKELTVIHE